VTELPQGWVGTDLQTVAEWGSGGTPKAGTAAYYGGEIPWAVIGDLTDGAVSATQSTITKLGLSNSSAKVVTPDCVLIAMYGSIGKLGLPTIPLATNQAIAFARPLKEVLARKYLFFYLLSQRSRLSSAGKGATQQNISQTILRSWPLPLPPVAEQHRIVAAIEEQFSRLDASVAALERIRQNLKRMRAAVLHAAVHANEADAGARWPALRVGDFTRVTSGATPARGNRAYWDAGYIPWVTSTLVNQESIASALEFITDLAVKETSVKLMPIGTLLVAMYGEGQTRGRCSELLIEATTNQACAAIVVDRESACSSAYLKLYFKASYEANRLLSAGGVQPNLSVGTLKNLLIAVPPMGEQIRIVRQTTERIDAVDNLIRQVDHLKRRQSALRSSVLSAAFSGKLAPQNPDDEPASILLKRITPERVSANGHRLPVRHPRAARPRVPA
jgi:type I restriction enzyme, S subunit